MTKDYPNGAVFLAENAELLHRNPYLSALLCKDAEVLKTPDAKNYAVRADAAGKTLLGIKVEPYTLLLYGDGDCLSELLVFLAKKQFDFDGVLCPTVIGERLIAVAPTAVQKRYSRTIGMDFMEATEVTEPSAAGIVPATPDDLEELFECTVRFIKDCGLSDEIRREEVAKMLPAFRLFKEDGKIVSMARASQNDERSDRISYVYTRPEFRGRGYARKVVNTVKNEILERGKIATLNVDQANPISNRLYASLGFQKVFSQGIYKAVT